MKGAGRGHASPRRAHQIASLNEKGLYDIFDRVTLLAYGRGQAVDPDGTTLEGVGHRPQQATVETIQATIIDIEHLQGLFGDHLGQQAIPTYLREVAGTLQKSIGNARRAARARGQGPHPGILGMHPKKTRGARHETRQIFHLVKLEPFNNPEAIAQRRGQKPGAGGGANQCKRWEIQFNGTRRRALAYQDVDLQILHGRTQHLLDHRTQAMDFIYKQDIMGLQIGEQGSQIPSPLKHRPRGLA